MPGSPNRVAIHLSDWAFQPLRLSSSLVLTGLLFWNLLAHAQQGPEYVRFVQGDSSWEGELQTAIASFENPEGVQLNLVAAVHLGEEEYFEELNSFFRTQDAVLYELVAEPNQVPIAGASELNTSVISLIQQSIAGFLKVEFQLDVVDYSPSNFLHADLTPSQLAELMASKNENFFTMFLNLLRAQMSQPSNAANESLSSLNMLSLMRAINSENQNSAIKYLFAEELGRSGGVIVPAELEEQLTLLGDRNKAALGVLREALLNPANRQISIFYGAAHMPGIEREIVASMGFAPTGLRWQAAWVVP